MKNTGSISLENHNFLGLPLLRVPKSPFVICSKMAAVGNRKHLFVVVWFSSPCSNMLTVRGPPERKNIWLLCIAERAHIYYTWCSVHLPKSQPGCSSISANTRTHNNTLFLFLFLKTEFLAWRVLLHLGANRVKYWVFHLGKFSEKTDGLPMVLQATPEFRQ